VRTKRIARCSKSLQLACTSVRSVTHTSLQHGCLPYLLTVSKYPGYTENRECEDQCERLCTSIIHTPPCQRSPSPARRTPAGMQGSRGRILLTASEDIPEATLRAAIQSCVATGTSVTITPLPKEGGGSADPAMRSVELMALSAVLSQSDGSSGQNALVLTPAGKRFIVADMLAALHTSDFLDPTLACDGVVCGGALFAEAPEVRSPRWNHHTHAKALNWVRVLVRSPQSTCRQPRHTRSAATPPSHRCVQGCAWWLTRWPVSTSPSSQPQRSVKLWRARLR
jgi:hypothetical protein